MVKVFSEIMKTAKVFGMIRNGSISDINRTSLISIIFLIALSITAVAVAAAVKQTATADVLSSYGPSEILTGTVKLNLTNTDADSNLTVKFGSKEQTIKLIDFLRKAEASFTCDTKNCSNSFTASAPLATKEITNNYIGLYIGSGTNIIITNIAFNMTGFKADTSYCGSIPVKLDLLEDDRIDWQYMESSDNLCSSITYNEEAYNSTAADSGYDITTTPYCEKIELIPGRRFDLGADIEGSSDAQLFMSISNGLESESCETAFGNRCCEIISGNRCAVNYTVPETGDYYICIRIYSETEESGHKLSGETQAPNCGQFGSGAFECSQSSVDYAIFAQPYLFKPFIENLPFDELSFLEFTSDNLLEYVNSYLNEKYDANCTKGCVIPIKLISNQNVQFSDLSFKYTSNLGSKTINNFYSAAKKSAKLNVSAEIPLEIGGFKTPSSYGETSLKITLDDLTLVDKKVIIEQVPKIESLSPLTVPAATAVSFSAVVTSPKNNTISSYNWDFGDGISQITEIPSITHTYGIGNFTLTLTVRDNQGLSAERPFSITVLEPKATVNYTLIQKKANLAKLTIALKSIPSWYSSLISKIIDTNQIKLEIAGIESKYNEINPDYVSLKLSLDDIFVPYKITDSKFESPMHSEPIASYAEELENSGLEDEELNAKIKACNDANAVITAFYTIKTATDDIKTLDLATEYKIEVKGNYPLKDVYLIIAPVSDDAVFKSSYSEFEKQNVSDAAVFKIDLEKTNTIEFAVSGKKTADEMIIFASPTLDNLNYVSEKTACGDGVCDKKMGEKYENCPLDCSKPYGKAIAWVMLILAVVAAGLFVIWKYYAVLYDKKLRAKLFDPIEDFHKLTFFIANEINKGKKIHELQKMLEEAGWKTSQIEYGLKKVKEQTKKMQKLSIVSFIKRELAMNKPEDQIKKELAQSGWQSSMIRYGFKKAKKETAKRQKTFAKASSQKK